MLRLPLVNPFLQPLLDLLPFGCDGDDVRYVVPCGLVRVY